MRRNERGSLELVYWALRVPPGTLKGEQGGREDGNSDDSLELPSSIEYLMRALKPNILNKEAGFAEDNGVLSMERSLDAIFFSLSNYSRSITATASHDHITLKYSLNFKYPLEV